MKCEEEQKRSTYCAAPSAVWLYIILYNRPIGALYWRNKKQKKDGVPETDSSERGSLLFHIYFGFGVCRAVCLCSRPAAAFSCRNQFNIISDFN